MWDTQKYGYIIGILCYMIMYIPYILHKNHKAADSTAKSYEKCSLTHCLLANAYKSLKD